MPITPQSGKVRDDGAAYGQRGDATGVVAEQPGPGRPKRIASVRLWYLVAGLFMGAAWAWNRGTPLWEHAVKLLVLMVVVSAVLSWQQRRGSRGAHQGPQVSIPRLVAAKVLLVAAAVAANWLLAGRVAKPDLIVATCLALFVALLGPHLHSRLIGYRGGDRRT